MEGAGSYNPVGVIFDSCKLIEKDQMRLKWLVYFTHRLVYAITYSVKVFQRNLLYLQKNVDVNILGV